MPDKPTASEREHLRVTVYTPESGLKNPLQLMAAMLGDMFCARSRDFAWRIFVRNMSARYRQSLLGYLWILIPPLLTSVVWVFLNRSSVVSVKLPDNTPYALYTLAGNLIWQGAVLALATPIRTLTQEKGTLTKINVPREAYLVAGFLEALLNACIPMLLLIPIMLFFRVTPGLSLVPGIAVFLGAVLASYTVGVLLTPVGLLYRDIATAIPVLSRFWFFVTPVAFAVPAAGLGRFIFLSNPATCFLQVSRGWILGTPVDSVMLPILAGYMGAALLTLLFGLVLYRLSMPIIIERMSS